MEELMGFIKAMNLKI